MLKVWTRVSFVTKPQLLNLQQSLNKLLPTWSSSSTSATVTTLTSFELASSKARVTSIKFNKDHGVSQSVGYRQGLPMIRLGSDKNTHLMKNWQLRAVETHLYITSNLNSQWSVQIRVMHYARQTGYILLYIAKYVFWILGAYNFDDHKLAYLSIYVAKKLTSF